MLSKRYLIWSSGGPPVQLSETIKKVKLPVYEIWTSGSGGDVV